MTLENLTVTARATSGLLLIRDEFEPTKEALIAAIASLLDDLPTTATLACISVSACRNKQSFTSTMDSGEVLSAEEYGSLFWNALRTGDPEI